MIITIALRCVVHLATSSQCQGHNFDSRSEACYAQNFAYFIAGPDSNACQFFVTARECSWLDGKHVVFGKVLKGMRVLQNILDQETQDDKPLVDCIIAKSGTIELGSPFEVPKEGADWTL